MTRLTDGRVMCCLCFEYRPPDQLVPDPDIPGVTSDVCVTCQDSYALLLAVEATQPSDTRDKVVAWTTELGRRARVERLDGA